MSVAVPPGTTTTIVVDRDVFSYRWRLVKEHGERRGHLCRILPRQPGLISFDGTRYIMVEFPDGLRVRTTRLAVKKVKPRPGTYAYG